MTAKRGTKQGALKEVIKIAREGSTVKGTGKKFTVREERKDNKGKGRLRSFITPRESS